MIRLDDGAYLGRAEQCFRLPGLVVSDVRYSRKVPEVWHYHYNHHLSLILAGGNREQRKNKGDLEVYPGKIMVYPAGLPHKNTHTVFPSKNINIEIEESFLRRYELDFSVNASAPVSSHILRIYKECSVNDDNSVASIHAHLLEILQANRFESKGRNIQWLTAARELVHDAWNRNVSLAEMSQSLGVHPVTVSKGFTKYLGCTLGEYSRKVKIQHAISMIRSTKKDLTEISLECGYFDQSHFIKAFKMLTGCTPREVKKM